MPEFAPFSYGNVLSQAENIKGARTQNALMKTQVQRQNALLQQGQTTFDQEQKDRSSQILADRMTAIANAQSPKQAASMLMADPEFQQASQAMGIPLERFGTDQADDEQIRQGAMVIAQALGGGQAVQQANFGAVSPDKFTPESLAQFQRTQDYSALVPSQSAGATPSNVQEYEYYNSLPTDEAREEYLRVKRGERGPSSTLEKRLFDVNDAAFKARSNQERYSDIANRMLSEMPSSGIQAAWSERYKELTGTEDAVTNLRKDWNNLRVSAAVQNLPPGVASDKDIELVMSAFLPANANPEAVASFMRGLSKLESLKAEYHEFESDYLSQNGNVVGMGKAWRDRLASQQMGQPQQPEMTATGPNGEKLVLRNGQWVPVDAR